jgi:hypothetical protein
VSRTNYPEMFCVVKRAGGLNHLVQENYHNYTWWCYALCDTMLWLSPAHKRDYQASKFYNAALDLYRGVDTRHMIEPGDGPVTCLPCLIFSR